MKWMVIFIQRNLFILDNDVEYAFSFPVSDNDTIHDLFMGSKMY